MLYKAGRDKNDDSEHMTGYTIDCGTHIRKINVWGDSKLRDVILSFLNGEWADIPFEMYPDTPELYIQPQKSENEEKGFLDRFEAEKWLDISNEAERTYIFPDIAIIIENPVHLLVKQKENGDSHRIVDADGECFYIPVGWRAIHWTSKDDDNPAMDF